MVYFFSLFFFIFILYVCFFFFFQAEDGIRDHCVTGVQTCALPIFQLRHDVPRCGLSWRSWTAGAKSGRGDSNSRRPAWEAGILPLNYARKLLFIKRSEERRVGKECRSRWSPYYEKKKRKNNDEEIV